MTGVSSNCCCKLGVVQSLCSKPGPVVRLHHTATCFSTCNKETCNIETRREKEQCKEGTTPGNQKGIEHETISPATDAKDNSRDMNHQGCLHARAEPHPSMHSALLMFYVSVHIKCISASSILESAPVRQQSVTKS